MKVYQSFGCNERCNEVVGKVDKRMHDINYEFSVFFWGGCTRCVRVLQTPIARSSTRASHHCLHLYPFRILYIAVWFTKHSNASFLVPIPYYLKLMVSSLWAYIVLYVAHKTFILQEKTNGRQRKIKANYVKIYSCKHNQKVGV